MRARLTSDSLFSLQDGTTPLFIASQRGHLEVVDRLIAARADVEARKTVRRDGGRVGLGAWRA